MKSKIMRVLEAVVGFPAAVARKVRTFGKEVIIAANAFTPATHKKVITKFTSSAIATRYLLGKSDGTQKGVSVCTTGDKAMFVIMDTASSTVDISLTNPAPVSCIMLGATDETVPMIAAGAIAVGAYVYPVANGQVNTYVGLGSTGTNYPCGVVVANAATQAGDIVEVMPILAQASATL